MSTQEQKARLGLIVDKAEIEATEKAIKTQQDFQAFQPPLAAPTKIDWRNRDGDWTTPVKDQASCGSCVAFGVAAEQQSNECITVDWKGTLDFIKDPEKAMGGGLRSWLWQTCTEFGFYQTCETNSSCPYGKGYHTLGQDFQICDYAFGISKTEVLESIEQTKEYYGGNKLLQGGSRIVSVNGNVDPWATLARDDDTPNSDDPLLPTFMVEGASHVSLYDVDADVDRAVTRMDAFFRKHTASK